MNTVDIHEAKMQLSRLVARAALGDMETAEPEIGVKVTLDEAKSDDEDEDVKGVYFVSGRVFYKETR